MIKQSNDLLNEYVVNQFPIKKFSEMIKACIGIVETFELILDDKDYYICYTSHYGIKIGTSQRSTGSKVETFNIKKYDNAPKMKEFILKYYNAFDSLSFCEKQVFKETFINNTKDVVILEKLGLYNDLLSAIRKSAIVRFSLILGFDKFVNEF